MAQVRKAVIPAAGLGTRFLPASKAVPKELLPLVDKPVLQAVVDEAIAAGLDHVGIVSSEGKAAVRAHFDPAPHLESFLEVKGDHATLERVRAVGAGAEISWMIQAAPRGLGDAVACAREFVAGEPFAVLLGDDLLDEADRALGAMIAVRNLVGGSVLLLVEVPEEMTSRFGIAAVEPFATPSDNAALAGYELVRVTGLQEKPAPADAASRLAIIGRYVLDPQVFDVLENTALGAGNELQLTDAIASLIPMPAEEGGGVHAIIFTGVRYDTGNPTEYLKAVVQVAARHRESGEQFRAWLSAYVESADFTGSSPPR